MPRDEFGIPVDSLPINTAGTTSNGSNSTNTEEKKEKGKGKGKKKRVHVKHPGLTNLKKLKDTPKSRMEGKLLNRCVLYNLCGNVLYVQWNPALN